MTDDLRDRLRSQIADRADQKPAAPPPEPTSIGARLRRAHLRDISTMFRQFGILVGAGYTPTRALAVLTRTTANADLRATVAAIQAATEQGTSLDVACARYPWYFDPGTVAVLRAASDAGNLPEAIDYIADRLENEVGVRDAVGTAMAYPVVLIIIGVAVVLLALTVIVPSFVANAAQVNPNVQFGWSSQLLIKVSDLVRTPMVLPVLVAALIGMGFAAKRWADQKPEQYETIIGNIPLIGRMVLLGALARVAELLHMLTANGVSLVDALTLSVTAVASPRVKRLVIRMEDNVRNGRQATDGARDDKRLPPLFCDLFEVGEESGRLPDVLRHTARYLRQELDRATARFAVLIQPVMLVLIGGFVVFVFLSVFAPYLDTLMNLSYGEDRMNG